MKLALTVLLTFHCIQTHAADDPLAPWMKNVRITQVSDTAGRHTMHSYYVANPESPDGKQVLFFASKHPSGYVGEVVIRERATGKETVLAENVHTEDAHRVACQQWLSGGRMVAFHEVVEKTWRVVVVDITTKEKKIVAEERQLGFGRPEGDLLPMYGCHWNPGPNRDLYVWDAKTGETRTALQINAVEVQHGEWMQKEFSGKPTSVFFPVLSPDLKRVFFKVAAGNGGDDYMAKNASHRQGCVCFELETARMKWFRSQWGHPAWHPDSRHIYEVGNVIFDTDLGSSAHYTKLKGVPSLRGMHPSISPDGRLMVTDGIVEGKLTDWCIMVADMSGEKWQVLHTFDQSKGAKSWRRSDPHPAFSADGKRIYYNTSDGEFTRLMVAEIH